MLQTRNNPISEADQAGFERLHDLIRAARAAGADAAEAVFAESSALSVGVRKGAVETVERDETGDLGLRVFVGRKQAVASVSEFSPATLERLVERAVAMARLAPDDPYAGLADPDRLYRAESAAPDLELFDATEPSAQSLQDQALAIEAAGLATPAPAGSTPGSLQSDAASAGFARNAWQFVTSDGFQGAHRTSLFFQSGRFIATDAAGQMERDGEGRSVRHASDLPDLAETGRIAAERALKALGARKIATQKTAVMFDRQVSRSLIGQFLAAISGGMIARGSSFLKDRLGQKLFDSSVQIIDDPRRVRGLGACLFDDEGVTAQRLDLVRDGVLTTWLLNTASARQLGMTTTGHASRGLAGAPGIATHNVTLSAGAETPQSLMRSVGQGVLITSMFGPSVNSDTGDWSAGASGFWFENGEIAYPVNEITVAGNLIDMFTRLVPASDLEIRGTLDAPSLLIETMSVGGK
ncbi:TldD/PmbA family protein [Asticcacaulis sp. EMRT-3]|uniref:TldD/PmbA family protein n=1 Tax=Asticcacaulis sp. EMRT-3 TaxID=3040349 RepID=UPI0024AF2607|nr:TldD/PmbA family protein [Asticcacaulis sp. EMRT-3]MDI7774093.1 TldD/PmbA family protein [Asticcacaulis sp. EMRT-3]